MSEQARSSIYRRFYKASYYRAMPREGYVAWRVKSFDATRNRSSYYVCLNGLFSCRQRFLTLVDSLLELARLLQSECWDIEQLETAQEECRRFVELYQTTVNDVSMEGQVPKSLRGKLLSTLFPKLHDLLHIPSSIWEFGPVNEFSSGTNCVATAAPTLRQALSVTVSGRDFVSVLQHRTKGTCDLYSSPSCLRLQGTFRPVQ